MGERPWTLPGGAPWCVYYTPGRVEVEARLNDAKAIDDLIATLEVLKDLMPAPELQPATAAEVARPQPEEVG